MSNMSYCRFQNTAGDFEDCLQALRDMNDNQGVEHDEEFDDEECGAQYKDLSAEEKSALKRMLENLEEYKELAEELLEANEC